MSSTLSTSSRNSPKCNTTGDGRSVTLAFNIPRWYANYVRSVQMSMIMHVYLIDVQTIVAPSSPSGNIHGVLSLGTTIFQAAWNRSVNETALNACLTHYKGLSLDTEVNSGIITRKVLPCLRMQRVLRWKLGLDEELRYNDQLTANITNRHAGTYISSVDHNTQQIRQQRTLYCDACTNNIDLCMCNSLCLRCFSKTQSKEPEATDMQEDDEAGLQEEDFE
jgi:hypothetical protein